EDAPSSSDDWPGCPLPSPPHEEDGAGETLRLSARSFPLPLHGGGREGAVPLRGKRHQNSSSCRLTTFPRSPRSSVSPPGDQSAAVMNGLTLPIEPVIRATSASVRL